MDGVLKVMVDDLLYLEHQGLEASSILEVSSLIGHYQRPVDPHLLQMDWYQGGLAVVEDMPQALNWIYIKADLPFVPRRCDSASERATSHLAIRIGVTSARRLLFERWRETVVGRALSGSPHPRWHGYHVDKIP